MSESTPRVVVLGRIHEAGIAALRAAGFAVDEQPDDPPGLERLVRDADAIVVRTTRIGADVVAAAPALQLVARHGVGYDAVDVDALSARGIPLALTGDVNSGAVAEHALALMLALAKRIPAYDHAIRTGDYGIRDTFGASELADKTLLCIGFGRIGRKVAALCRALSMRVLVSDPFAAAGDVEAAGATPIADLREGLAAADWVTLHAPRSASTEHLLGRAEIGAMKPGAFLVNVARGGLVDEVAALEALEAEHLAGIGLDVFEHEPLPADDPLARHPRTVLTPHSAAFTAECSRRMALACARNVIDRFGDGLDPEVVVNDTVLGDTTPAAGRSPSC
ncbi:MAG: hydroxyacid dehydrogenase [Halofilum sp. (in: g-proteobacteria)]|nr:hydroxyacid dehydrogenase [Halofilum sp. (in: g-proteobacteria)]